MRNNWRTELHFSEVKRFNAHLYREVVRMLAGSDARFTCIVIDREKGNPFDRRGREPWKVQAQAVISLLGRSIIGDEIATVTIDHLSLPSGVSYEGYIRTAVNKQKGRLALATVCRMDSRACWGLQLADLLTGAVAHQYRQQLDRRVKAGTTKGKLASHVAEQFNLGSLVCADTTRLRVIEQETVKRPTRRLAVVSGREAERLTGA